MGAIISIVATTVLTLFFINFIGGLSGFFVIIVSIVIFNFLEPVRWQSGWVVAGLSGFICDLYASNTYFGFYFLGLLIIPLLTKQVVKKII